MRGSGYKPDNYIGIIDQEVRWIFKSKNRNDLKEITKVLEPYKKEIEGIVAE